MNVSRPAILETGKHVRDLQLALPEGLFKRIELLKHEDRLLIELALSSRASTRRIAGLLHCSAACVSRRLRRINARLHDPVVLAMLHPACPLDPAYRQIGVERLLCHHSTRELAERHQRPVTEIRRIVHLVQLWYRGVAAGRSCSSNGLSVASPKPSSPAKASTPA